MQKRKKFSKRYTKNDFILKGKSSGVKIPAPEAFEKGLKIWKRQVKESGVIQELKSRREYIKPSAMKRKLRNDAKRKQEYRTRIEKRYWDTVCWSVLTDNMDYGPTLPDSLM